MSLAFALDLGTTSLSAVAVARDGTVVARLNRPNPAHVTGLPTGHAEQDPVRLREAAFDVLRELAQTAPGNPMCLGLTGQMHGGLLVDRTRRPLTNLITWQDRRALEHLPPELLAVPEFDDRPASKPSRTFLDEFRLRCRQEDVLRTGCNPSAGYLAVTAFALAVRGEIPATMHRATTIADWIAAELVDVDPVTDRTDAASTGVFDLEYDRWNRPMLEATGLNPDWFPEVRRSGTPIGVVSPEAAAATSLPAGMPVCNALGDNQAAVLGSVPSGDSAIQINIGTGGQINWSVPSFRRIDHMDTRPLPHGRFMLVGAGLAGGDAYAWVCRTVQSWLTVLGVPSDPDAIYETLNRLAAAAPSGCDGLNCRPTFRGTRSQPDVRGAFQGVTNENFTPGNVARAVLEGTATLMLQLMTDSSEPPASRDRLIGTGNGLRKNPLLVRIFEEAFSLPMWLTQYEEEAAVGAALLAGSEVGLWPDLATAGKNLRLHPGGRAVGS